MEREFKTKGIVDAISSGSGAAKTVMALKVEVLESAEKSYCSIRDP